MKINLTQIFNIKSKAANFAAGFALCLLFTFVLVNNVAAQDRKRLGAVCDADGVPNLTNDANCPEGKSCQTKPGCLDPAPLKPVGRLSSTAGPRINPVSGKKQDAHGGLDYAAALGAAIYAAGDGKVVQKGGNDEGYGNRITIEHPGGMFTLYGHMNCYARKKGHVITPGDTVKKGEVIGFVGTTGASTGPHLHFEVKNSLYKGKQDPLDPKMQGIMCKIPDKYAEYAVPSEGISGDEGGSCAPASGCAKMYPSDNISELHHKYESGGKAGAFNNCVVGDIGGCSYGSSQLACGKPNAKGDSPGGTMKTYLEYVQKNKPDVWKKISQGKSLSAVVSGACHPGSDPAGHQAFVNNWKSLNNDKGFADSQEAFIKATHYDSAASTVKKQFGVDFSKRSPEAQMALYSASVALGPGGASNKWLFRDLKAKYGDKINDLTDEQLIAEMYKLRDNYYGSSSAAIRASVQKRNANEGAEVLESLKIRQAWEAEQKKPKGQQKTYEQIVEEVTGKKACAAGQSGSFNCSASGASGSSNNPINGDKNCAPSQYSSAMGDCMFCPLFQVIFNTASKIAKLSFNKLSMPIMSLVLVAFALWLSFTILQYISSMQTKDAPTLLKTIMSKGFVVLIAVIFLKEDSSTFFQMAMEPIFNTGFKLAQLVVGDGVCKSTYAVMEDGGLPASMGTSILCTIEAIQHKLQDSMALGAASMCVGFFIKADLFIFPSLPYVITGILIWCGAGIVMLIFPFLMLDSIFQLTVASALVPAAIGAYPFKATKGYATHVWDAFINAMFNFVFLSIIIMILTTAIDVAVQESIYDSISKEEMDEKYIDVIVGNLAWGGVAVIKIVFVLLLGWAILDEAAAFANQFSGGMSSGKIGSQIGGLAANGAKALGTKAWGGAKTVGSAVGENVKESVKDWNRDRKMSNLMNDKSGVDVKDESGKVIGREVKNKSWFRGRDKTNVITYGENGTRMLSVTKDYGNGKVKTTQSDGYLKQETLTQNGKIIGGSLSIETAGLKAIRNNDGTMNTPALDDALRNSAFSENMIKAAAMQQYAQQSFPEMKAKFQGPIDEKNISISTDADGREVLQIKETNDNGSSQAMRMTMGDNSRAVVELERTTKEGKQTSHATDGMFNRIRTAQVNMKTGEESAVRTNYYASDYYAQRAPYPVNAEGEFARAYTKNGGSAFGLEDQKQMMNDFREDRIKERTRKAPGMK